MSIEILLETDFLIMWPFYQYFKLGMMLGISLKEDGCKIWVNCLVSNLFSSSLGFENDSYTYLF